MEISLQKEKLPTSLPLPIYTSIPIGRAIGKTGEEFTVVIGLDKTIVRELKKLSLDSSDTDLQENTSDRERFGEGSYESWYKKGRVPFALIHTPSNHLAALVWFGPKPLGRKSLKHLSEAEKLREGQIDGSTPPADAWHTVTYRTYLPFRGQGLMKEFSRSTKEIYKRYNPNVKLWAGINAKNLGSVAIAEKLGLLKNETLSDEAWCAMTEA